MELLAVVSVIVILVALALPVINRTLESGRDAKCMQNMQTLCRAFRLYQVDHNGALPPNASDGSISNAQNVWTVAIRPYLGVNTEDLAKGTLAMARYLTCPSENSREVWNPPSLFWHSHYGVNGSGPTTFNFNGSEQRPSVAELSKTMMLIETRNARSVRARASSIATIASRHRGFSNIVFFDGHLEKIRLENVPASGGNVFWREY